MSKFNSNKSVSDEGRRKLLKSTSVVAGSVVVAQSDWAKPILNSVILPTHAQASAVETIAEIAVATEDLSTLVSLLTGDQVDALNSDGPLTVFAPTNDAFAAISAVTAGLTGAQITDVVNYHVLAGSFTFADIPVTTGAAPNLIATVQASNGIVYVIDQVLLP